MGKTSKTFALLLTLIISLSCLTALVVKPANAQTINIPQFQATVDSTVITITITNQPFTPYYDNYGALNLLYYNVRVGNASTSDWTELYDAYDGYPQQTNAVNTTVIIRLKDGWETPGVGHPVPVSSVFDIEVQAMIGHTQRAGNIVGPGGAPWVFSGQTSDWSNPQTLTTDYYTNDLSPTPNPSSPSTFPTSTSTPISTSIITPNNSMSGNQQLTNIALIVAVAVFAVAVASLLVYVRRIKNRLPKQ